MGKTFREPEVVLQCALGIEERVRRDRSQRTLIQCRPTGRSAFGIEGEPARVKLVLQFGNADCALEDSLTGIRGEGEVIRHKLADGLAQKFDQLPAHVGFQVADQTVDDLHPRFDDVLAGLRFPLHVVQDVVDVSHDLLQLIGRIAFEDQHHVMGKIGQACQAAQEIPNLVLCVLHNVREFVQSLCQVVAPTGQLLQFAAQFGQHLLHQLSFGDLLPGDHRLRTVKPVPHRTKCIAEASPTSGSRVHSDPVAVGPDVVDQRLHHGPQQRLSDPGAHGPGAARRREVLRLRGRGQHVAAPSDIGCRLGPRVIGRAQLHLGPQVPAREDAGRRPVQQRLGRILIPQPEH
ncbi:hypothetical protein A5701_20995 [Mycobacterium sp. E3305]|nr:hypothetical protein A5701_20995 [Mycobacterium sp. E3305]